jgi:hypothetical protein
MGYAGFQPIEGDICGLQKRSILHFLNEDIGQKHRKKTIMDTEAGKEKQF